MTLVIAATDWFWPTTGVLIGLMMTMCLRTISAYVEQHTARVMAEFELMVLRREQRRDDTKTAVDASKAAATIETEVSAEAA